MEFQDKYADFFETVHPDYFDQKLFVPGFGCEESKYALIGEAPGANEVKQGKPFVGRAGKRLDEILSNIGVKRSELYITNLVKVRPPNNRNPTKKEIAAWAPLLREEIDSVKPEIIITLGNFASRQMLDTSKGISQIHGRIFTREGLKIMPTYHPAATLYDRSKGPELEKDLRKAFQKEESGQRKLDDLT